MIATIVFDDTEINHVTDFTYMDMLGDTGAQGHVFPPTPDMKKRRTTEVVKMANGSKSTITKEIIVRFKMKLEMKYF